MKTAAEPLSRIKEGFIGQKLIVLPPDIRRAIVANPVIKNFHLTAMGHYPKASRHGIERAEGCAEYILIYCIEGRGDITLGPNTYDVCPNTYFIIPPHVPHRYESSVTAPWSIYWVLFTGTVARHVYKRALLNEKPAVHNIPFDENRIREFELIFHLLEHSYDEKEMEILNVHLLHFISSMIYYKETTAGIHNGDIAGESIDFMKKNIDKKFTIEDLSAQQRLSVSHYSRIFKQRTGMSPIQYFNQLKIQQSCQYLYFTNMNIKEICLHIGFDDPFYFSRLFTKLMGVSPSAYKKTYKG